jgi:hypothetical protein
VISALKSAGGAREWARGWNWLYSLYDNVAVWEIHRKQIEEFIDVVESKHARLIVIIFPSLVDPSGSIPYVRRVAQVFEARGYHDDIIELLDQAEAAPLNDRIASSRDGHPGPVFSRTVAKILYERITAQNPSDPVLPQ